MLSAALMNCLAGSDILLGSPGVAVHMAACMLASDSPGAEKGALWHERVVHMQGVEGNNCIIE